MNASFDSTAKQQAPKKILVRALTEADSSDYRALRQKILAIGDGRYFNTSYTREGKLTERQWRNWCTETKEHCIFGTFYNDKLIGVMMITMFGNAEDHTAEWEATWLDPAYRGWGIAKLSYQKVQEWTVEHGYKYAKIFIREDNTHSRQIREKQGFVYIETLHNEVWADGSIASEHVFVKALDREAVASVAPYIRAAKHIEQIFQAL